MDSELDDLVNLADRMQEDMKNNKDEMIFDKPKPATTLGVDVNNKKAEAERKAKNLMDSMFRQYVQAGIIGDQQYLMAKNIVSTANIATLIRQINICEDVVSSILDQIDIDFNPKLYDCLANTQRTMLDLIKLEQSLIKNTETGYKELIEDIKTVEEAKVVREEGTDPSKLISTNRQLIEIVKSTTARGDN
jgi:hypothetical protein